jgi:hypothetical protein
VSEIWAACSARAERVPLAGVVLRLVESQEQVATNSLVRTLAEQALLEDLIESSKPRHSATTSGLHYLLATPFRYPPLPWGSRFGSRFEPGLFYGARSAGTTLAESAYYRFVFWSGMATPPQRPLNTSHTMFKAPLRTERGLRLQEPPFDEFMEVLTDPRRYDATQALGARLREEGIEAFEYRSARDPGRGINVALFSPAALAANQPDVLEEWLCNTNAERVSYYSRHGGGMHVYPLSIFVVDGVLPLPAA